MRAEYLTAKILSSTHSRRKMDDIPGEGSPEQDEDKVKYKRSRDRCDPRRCECLSHTNVMIDLV